MTTTRVINEDHSVRPRDSDSRKTLLNLSLTNEAAPQALKTQVAAMLQPREA